MMLQMGRPWRGMPRWENVADEEAEAGKGTMLAASFLRLAFNCPGNRRQVVTPDIVSETRWLRSP